jgi:TolB-like protein
VTSPEEAAVKRIAAAISLALLCAACGGPRQYVKKDVDLGTMERVAVLPFENVTGERLSAERVQRIFVTELLTLGAFEVVEPGLVTRAFRRDALEAAALTPEDAKKLGKELGAQGLFIGTVMEFEEVRSGSVAIPRVTIQLRLVETETGSTVWSISGRRSGTTMSARLFGVGGNTTIGLAENLIRDELGALVE